MDTLDNWRKSSYSGPGDGDSCVEIANTPTRVAIRDTKDPTRATLTIPPTAFTPFIDSLKPPHLQDTANPVGRSAMST